MPIEAVINLLQAIKGSAEPLQADEELVVCKAIGADEEQRYTLGVAYWADRADVGKALDGFRDFSSKKDVEQAAWKYLANGSNVGLFHEKGTDGTGRVVESYVYRGPDWHVTDANGKEQVIKAGDWLLGTVWPPEVWPAVKAGLINGYSWQGGCKRTTPTAEVLAALRS